MLIVSSTKSHQYLAKSIKSNNNGTCTRNLHRTRALCISLEIYDSILIAEKKLWLEIFWPWFFMAASEYRLLLWWNIWGFDNDNLWETTLHTVNEVETWPKLSPSSGYCLTQWWYICIYQYVTHSIYKSDDFKY